MGFFNATGQQINQIPTFPCETSEVFIMGLKEGEKLISYDPFIIFNQNGQAIGLDSQFNQFYHLDSNSETIKLINIDWVSDCDDMENLLDEECETQFFDFNYEIKELLLPAIVLVMIFSWFVRRVIYAKIH